MNRRTKRICVFVGLKAKEVVLGITVIILGIFIGILLGMVLRLKYFFIVLCIILGGGLFVAIVGALYDLVPKWIKSNWDKAGRIVDKEGR